MTQRTTDAVVALRQIQRKIELDSNKLARDARLTHSQLRVLQLLDERERPTMTASDLAKETKLSNATITALIDKLAARGFALRQRCESDRRKVWVEILPEGRQALSDVSKDLQQMFEVRFGRLEDWEQAMLVAALEKVASLLDAEALDAAPILTVGEIGDSKPKPPQ